MAYVNAIFNVAGTASPEPTSLNNNLAKYSECLALQDGPWVPPASLETALRKIQDLPVVWLNHAVDVMAFGNENAVSDPMEFAARRCQASRALCQAARTDLVRAIGNPDQPGDGSIPIPRAYFDVPRQLGDADNSIVTDIDNISDDDFTIATSGGHQKWFNVRIETQSLLEWLRGFVAAREPDDPSEYLTGATSDLAVDPAADIEALVRENQEIAQSGERVTAQTIPAKYRRFPLDETLVAEAIAGLETGKWANKHQAAIALAERAEGSSIESKVRRLEGKMSKSLETTRNNSKD